VVRFHPDPLGDLAHEIPSAAIAPWRKLVYALRSDRSVRKEHESSSLSGATSGESLPGRVAERLGRGLQSLASRFKSGRDLLGRTRWLRGFAGPVGPTKASTRTAVAQWRSSGFQTRVVEGSIPSCRASPPVELNAGKATDVYPNRVKELGRKPSASWLWGFESLGVHSGDVLLVTQGYSSGWQSAPFGRGRPGVQILLSLLGVGWLNVAEQAELA
jgi:hypothetical protein